MTGVRRRLPLAPSSVVPLHTLMLASRRISPSARANGLLLATAVLAGCSGGTAKSDAFDASQVLEVRADGDDRASFDTMQDRGPAEAGLETSGNGDGGGDCDPSAGMAALDFVVDGQPVHAAEAAAAD